jgi:hypothetical protein
MLPIIFHSLSLLVPLADEGFKHPQIAQLRGAHMLTPWGLYLTPFRYSDSASDIFNIAGFPGYEIFLPHKKRQLLWQAA